MERLSPGAHTPPPDAAPDPAEAGRLVLELLRDPGESWAARDLAAAAGTMSGAVPPDAAGRFPAASVEIDRLAVDLVRHAVRLERRAERLGRLGPACRDAGPREPGGGLGDLAEAARRSALEMAGTLRETVTVAIPRWKAGFDLAGAARVALAPEPGPDATPEARVQAARERAAALREDGRSAAPAGADAALEGIAAVARGLRRLVSRDRGGKC